tara:strand:+ start:899 stop:1681 length:783 start_codon:yes stop_codon:yes gene_type:complete
MKVKVISDLHLEFDNEDEQFDPGTGDVLILAGDICVAAHYDWKYHDFFLQCVQNYNKVFYVLGNHEGYDSSLTDAIEILRKRLPFGITIMNNRSEFVGGVHFIGATLWTNMNNLNAETIEEARECMNDYRLIDGFTPEKSIEEHMFTREWFERCLPTLNGPVFVMTHHAPSTQSVSGRYMNSAGMYSSDMESFIENHPGIKWWCHGHIHHNNDYMVHQCRVISNPRGYNHSELNKEFNINFEVDIPEEMCYNKGVKEGER